MNDSKPNILFLCTGNACRSQMAEGFARHFHSDKLSAFSAGVEPHGKNPLAMQVMAEAGVPESTMLAIMGHMSRKMLERYSHIRMQAKRDAVESMSLRHAPQAIEGDIPTKNPTLSDTIVLQ